MGSRRGKTGHSLEGLPHGGLIDRAGGGIGHQRGRFKAEKAGISLAEFLTAAVAMEVAIGAHIDHHVEGVEAAAEPAEDLIATGSRGQCHVDHLGAAAGAPAPGHVMDVAENGRRSSRDRAACSSAPAWRASVGASGSAAAAGSQRQSGSAAQAWAISPPNWRSSSYSEAFSRRICFSSVRMLTTWPTLVGTPQKSR